jgi:hypothetical protein
MESYVGKAVHLKDGRVVMVVRVFDENYLVCRLPDMRDVLVDCRDILSPTVSSSSTDFGTHT